MADGAPAPYDQRVQIINLRAVAYRAEPTDEHFQELLQACSDDGGNMLLTDVVYRVASSAKPLRAPVLVHLLHVLVVNDRWLEVLHFCRQWIEQEPESIEAHDLAAEAACRCFDIREARAMVEALERLGAGDGVVGHFDLAYRLTFCGAKGADEVVRRLLRKGRTERRTEALAVDAALRLENPLLLMEILLAHPGALARGGDVARARSILRDRIKQILRIRATAGEP